MRLRSVTLALAAFFGIGALAGPATAGILDDLLSGPGGVLGQTLTEVDEQTCPAVGDVPGIGPTLCSLSIAGFQYRTTYLRPDGTELVRTVNATAAVPSLLRVDADLLPDLTATLLPKSTSRFELTVMRNLTAPAYLPYKVEIIVPDPTGKLPRQKIFLGYDARSTGKSPNTWKGEVRILESTPARTALGFEVKRSDNPAVTRIATVGGLFNGDAGNRVDPISAVLDQQPMPKNFAARLVLAADENGQDDMTIGVGASSPISLTGDVLIANGNERRVLRAQAIGLPTELTVDLDAIADAEQKVTYLASDRVTSLSLDSDFQVSGASQERLKLDLADVPKDITFHQTSKQAGNVTTSDGWIGSAQVQVSTKGYQVPLLPAVGAFAQYETPATFDTEDAPSMLAVRVEKLLAATYDVGEDTSVDLKTGAFLPPFGQDLKIHAAERDRTVDATVVHLPQHVTFSTTSAGQIDYDGHQATVPEVTATIRALNGTTLSPDVRYTGVDAKINDLPSLLDVSIAPDNNRFTADMNGQTVGRLEAHAFTTGASCVGQLADAAGPLNGAALVDTPAVACVAGRFSGLKSAEVTLEPLDVEVLSAASQKLNIFGTFNEAEDNQPLDGTLTGVVDQMPTEFSLKETPVTEVVPGVEEPVLRSTKYDVAANANVGLVTIKGIRLPLATFPAEILNLRVEQIPRKVHLELPAEGAPQKMVADVNVTDDPEAHVGLVEMEQRSGNGLSCIANLNGRSGMAFEDTPAQECTGLRIRGLKDAIVSLDPLKLDLRAAATQVFLISGYVDDPDDDVAGPGVLTGDIQALPTRLDLHEGSAPIAQDPNGRAMTLHIDEVAPKIGALRLEGQNLPERFPARVLDVEILDVPSKAFISLPVEGDIKDVTVNTFGEGIGMVRFEANDGVSPVTTEENTDHVKIRGSNLAFRAYDVEKVAFRAPLDLNEAMAGTMSARLDHDLGEDDPSKPLDIDIQTGDAIGDSIIQATIAAPPHKLGFTKTGRMNPGSPLETRKDVIGVDANGGIPNLFFKFEKIGIDQLIEVNASDLPKRFDLCVWSAENGSNDSPPFWHPDSRSQSWCYQPVKAPFLIRDTEDGHGEAFKNGDQDQFVSFDTIQLSLDVPDAVLASPIRINRVVIKSRDDEGLSKTTVSDAKVGEFTFGFGSGTLPKASTAEFSTVMDKMYGKIYDTDPLDHEVFTDYTWNEGLHLFLNTDENKVSVQLAYDFLPAGAPGDEVEETRLDLANPLFARNKAVVLDTNGVPTQSYVSGYIGICDPESPTTFNLKLPGKPIIGPVTLTDFLDCDFTDNGIED